MPGYIYRDELLEHLRPLLELLNITPEALVTLRVTPRGIELDYRQLPPDPFKPLEFAFFNIADRDPILAPVDDDRATEHAIDRVQDRLDREHSE